MVEGEINRITKSHLNETEYMDFPIDRNVTYLFSFAHYADDTENFYFLFNNSIECINIIFYVNSITSNNFNKNVNLVQVVTKFLTKRWKYFNLKTKNKCYDSIITAAIHSIVLSRLLSLRQ